MFLVFKRQGTYFFNKNIEWEEIGFWKNMKKKRLQYIILTMLFVLSNVGKGMSFDCYAKEDEPFLYAKYAAVVDASTGRTLFSRNGDCQVPMASTTKILTCILALENGKLDDLVSVSKAAAKMPPVKMGIKEGEKYRLEDLLYALMLESYNDTAVAIAEHISGSTDAFAKLMNDKAKSIGCEKFFFITPNGLDKTMTKGNVLKEHSISPVDLAKIMNYCCNKSNKKKEFIKITRKKNLTISSKDGKRIVQLNNHNQLLSNDMVISGKTGFTGKAGYCYVACIKLHGCLASVALQACGWPNNKSYKWKDMANILEYLKKNFVNDSINSEVEIPRITALGAQHYIGKNEERTVSIYFGFEKTEFLRKNDEKICTRINMQNKLKTPIMKGEKLGEIIWMVDDDILFRSTIKSNVSVKKNSFYLCFIDCLKRCILCV